MVPLCLSALFQWSLPSVVSAANSLTMCSNANTGAQGESHFSIYNSYGYCTQHCTGFAYAIMQGQNCWCSNETPGLISSIGDCSQSCPGFDSDKCGNADQGLFGYAQIGQPSGTQQASFSSQSSTSSSSSSSSSTSNDTSSSAASLNTSSSSTISPSETTTSSSSTQSSSPGSPSSTTDSSSASSTSSSITSLSSLDPSTLSSSSTETTTSNSESSTPNSTTSASNPTASSGFSASDISPNSKYAGESFWQQSGKVAGTFVGVGFGILVVLALLVFFCLRRRRRNRSKMSGSLALGPSSRKNTSPMSPFGNSSRFTSTDSHAFATFAKGSVSSHTRVQSRDSGLSEPDFIPIFDQRVDPNQLYMRYEHNGSKTSLQDFEDYSRKVLTVANPDEKYTNSP